jgi:hypothetical protein
MRFTAGARGAVGRAPGERQRVVCSEELGVGWDTSERAGGRRVRDGKVGRDVCYTHRYQQCDTFQLLGKAKFSKKHHHHDPSNPIKAS